MGRSWSKATEWRARNVYAIRFMTDWRVNTSMRVGRGRAGFDFDLDGKEEENLEDSEPFEDDLERRREADESS
jgi:hypothetical protein